MDHFGLPLLLNRFEEIRPYLPHASLECADLQGLIASWERRCSSRKISPPLRSGLAWSQEKICSHSPSKGSLWVRRQPRIRFLRSCSRYRVSSPAGGTGAFLTSGRLPAVHCATEKTWRGSERGDETKGAQPIAQRNTACRNCSSWRKRRMGSSACATPVSSCCLLAGRTSERNSHWSGVFAGS
jgi:hypothetical protein